MFAKQQESSDTPHSKGSKQGENRKRLPTHYEPTDYQLTPKSNAKRNLSPPKRYGFATQKVWFQTAKGMLRRKMGEALKNRACPNAGLQRHCHSRVAEQGHTPKRQIRTKNIGQPLRKRLPDYPITRRSDYFTTVFFPLII